MLRRSILPRVYKDVSYFQLYKFHPQITQRFIAKRIIYFSNFLPSHHFQNFLLTKCMYNFFKNEIPIDYKKNYYQILNVKQNSSLIQIKKSFYKLAKESHPDTSKGNQELFKLINEAYNVLSHQQRKKMYDANRQRPETQNINSAQQQTQTNSQQYSHNYDQFYSQTIKQEQQYGERQEEAYYHYSRGQWQQFRSGYKYHMSPESQYYSNMTNNTSYEKIFQNIKRKQTKKTHQEQQFLKDMENYFQYTQKIKKKQKIDMEEYHKKMQQLQNNFYEERKQLLKKTIFGRLYIKIQKKITAFFDSIQKYLAKDNGSKQK